MNAAHNSLCYAILLPTSRLPASYPKIYTHVLCCTPGIYPGHPEGRTICWDRLLRSGWYKNIVSNAINHTGKGGTITVTAKSTDDKIIVQVKDTGVGMTKNIMENLFTPQMKKLTETRINNKGAGIGLLLVEKNGGEIWVESILGQGSSFYFTLPIGKPLYKIGSSEEIMFDESA